MPRLEGHECDDHREADELEARDEEEPVDELAACRRRRALSLEQLGGALDARSEIDRAGHGREDPEGDRHRDPGLTKAPGLQRHADARDEQQECRGQEDARADVLDVTRQVRQLRRVRRTAHAKGKELGVDRTADPDDGAHDVDKEQQLVHDSLPSPHVIRPVDVAGHQPSAKGTSARYPCCHRLAACVSRSSRWSRRRKSCARIQRTTPGGNHPVSSRSEPLMSPW